jgi:hypothetical protein
MLAVFRDEGEPTRTRVEAATWLADRGFGKPMQLQAVELNAGYDVEGARERLMQKLGLGNAEETVAKLRAEVLRLATGDLGQIRTEHAAVLFRPA